MPLCRLTTPDTVAANDTRTQIKLTINVSASTTTTFSGPLNEYFELPQGTAPGTYTIGFTLHDQGHQSVSYGMPGSSSRPVPGGPVILTVTDPTAAGCPFEAGTGIPPLRTDGPVTAQ
ncbi:hypothetical protein [Streptomyces sp. NPDC048637]|uniref:hypothetical protein n=1 Tax=Streptomyces sp. NPDC048637 TaxID=3155636 RepID=UPI00342CD115